MRLIDADYIFENLHQEVIVTGKENVEAVVKALEEYNNIIRNAPTIDAIEVVRCRNCKHGTEKDGYIKCDQDMDDGVNWDKNDYCSYGDKKE